MTHTDKLRRALRAYDIAGPETPERADALATVLLAAHNLCAIRDTICSACNGSGEPIDINKGYMFCMCGGTGRINAAQLYGWPGSPTPELPTPLQIEVANLRRQLRDTQDDLQRARYSPAEHWT